VKPRGSKLPESTKATKKPEAVVLEDVLQKITRRNLAITIQFKLTPIAYGLCSHLKAILYFDGQHLKTFYTTVPGTMKNLRKKLKVEVLTKFGQVTAGPHQMKIEMSGLFPSGQTLGLVSSKEFTVNVPNLEELDRSTARTMVIERIEGESGIDIVTPGIKKLYKQIEERRKREMQATRQGW
jgi:hypothetical protein